MLQKNRILAAALTLAFVFAAPPDGEASCVAQIKESILIGGTNGATSIAAGDLDGDGDLDVVTASFGDDKIAWYDNDGGDPPVFTQVVISTRSDSAVKVVVHDLDEDGDLDILAASSNDDEIAWFDNNGGDPPFFLERVITRTADLALDVAVGDVDGDDHLDVLAASFRDDTVAWYRSNGAATPFFTERIVTTEADGASGVAAGDLDGDGDTDIAVASRIDNTIAWYESDGADPPVFTKIVIDSAAPAASRVEIVDLNGDDDLDVVASISGADTVAWYDSDGADPPTFTKRVIVDDAANATDFAVGDVDNDGNLDVAVASAFDNTLAWFRNGGGAAPTWSRRDVTTDLEGANGVFIADVDVDMDNDLLSTASLPGSPATGDRVSYWESDGAVPAPTFTERTVTRAAVVVEAVAVADLDDDGDLDIVQASSTDDRISWLENDGATAPDVPTFGERIVSMGADGARDVEVADIDGDMRIDILSASENDGKIALYLNDGADPPGFVEEVISTTALGAQKVAVADIDGDMDLDVLSASFDDSRIAWYENDGLGTWTETTLPMPLVDEKDPMSELLYQGATSVTTGDLDGDGFLDVVATFFHSDALVWYPGREPDPPGFGEPDTSRFGEPDTSRFGEPIQIANFLNGVRDVVVADLDGDLDIDIATASELDNSIRWFENTGPPKDPQTDPGRVSWVGRIIADLAFRATSVAVADMDGDMELDLLSSSAGNSQLFWYENDSATPPAFIGELIAADATNAQDIAAGDLDGDGRLDAVGASAFESAWYRTGEETCQTFDASGDMTMDGVELAWVARAFGLSAPVPVADWWAPVDYTGDGFIDGDDLAVLTSFGVWGRSVSDCFFVCNP